MAAQHKFTHVLEEPVVSAFSRVTTDYACANEITSMMDLEAVMVANQQPCRFCGHSFIGTPFNAHTLLTVHDRTRHEMPVCVDSDDDDNDMSISSGPLPIVSQMLSQSLRCCSAACWMAESLSMQGEASPIGRVLGRSFPTLAPNIIGGAHLERYITRRQELADSTIMTARRMAARNQ